MQIRRNIKIPPLHKKNDIRKFVCHFFEFLFGEIAPKSKQLIGARGISPASRTLFEVLTGEGEGAVGAADEDLAVVEEFGSLCGSTRELVKSFRIIDDTGGYL